MEIGKLFVAIAADLKDFKAGMAEANKEMKGLGDTIKEHSLAIGAAFTAIGAAGLKFASDARKLNANLGQTALTLGIDTGEMRKLALATTNVTFPLKSVTDTFALLSRAGVRNTEELKASANAFDALADATGSSAEVVADILIPAFKAFGVKLPMTSEEMDKFTWLTKNTTVDLADFGNVLTYLAPDMDKLNLSMDDAIGIMAILESRGITGGAATREFRKAVTEAVNENKALSEVLGISQVELGGYQSQMFEAIGITNKYAEVANSQYGIMDKLKQTWSELTFRVGSFLTPLEPVMAAMTGLGSIMMTLHFVNIPRLIGGIRNLGMAFLTLGAKAITAAAGLIVKAVAALWAWAGGIPFVGIGLGIAGAAAIAASIFAIKAKMKSFKYGGIVPGAIGEPVPVIAHGGERFMGSAHLPNLSPAPSVELHIHTTFFGGSRADAAKLADFLGEALRGKQRGMLGEAQW